MNDNAVSLLEICKEYFPDNNVILAGGAVRDYLNNKEHRISDWDIYLYPTKATDKMKFLGDLRNNHGFEKLTKTYTNPKAITSPASAGTNILYYEWGHYKDLLINFLFITMDPKQYVKDFFDIGLCECWLNPQTWDFGHTDNYLRDVRDKTITCRIKPNMSEFAIGRSLSYHLLKVAAKYPEHTVKIINMHLHNGEKM